MNHWNDHKANSQSLIEAEYAGRDCWQATTTIDDDMGGKYGDGIGGVIRKRAQKSSKIKVTPPSREVYEFSLCFPKEWVFAPNGMTVMSLHHSSVTNPDRGVTPLDFIVRGDRLVCIHYPTVGEAKTVLFYVLIVPDMWMDFKIDMKLSTANDGFIFIMKNSQQIVEYHGKTVDVGDTDLYLKVGPYVYKAFPDGVSYRRMYFQI